MQVIAQANNKPKSIVTLLALEMRPYQWTKNLVIFAALIFSIKNPTLTMPINSIYGFILFSLVSSCVYILNDYMDLKADRQHPEKKLRPMAAGELDPNLSLAFSGILLMVCLGVSALLNTTFSLLLTSYFIINMLYSISLKHVVIVDVMTIALGFVIRAISGAVLINVKLTPWFLLCIMLLSLFLAISKRRTEYILSHENNIVHRKVLQFYNIGLLDQMNTIVITSTLISYALFTFTSGRTIYLMWTIPFVIYGMFRYLYLIHVEGKGGNPDKLLFDRHIGITVLLYTVSVILILRFCEQ